jgi:hypothetical protein
MKILVTGSSGQYLQSAITLLVGSKGYHDQVFQDGPYPVEPV